MANPRPAAPQAADDPLAIDSQLCFSVYSAAHAFTRLYYKLLQPIDITYTQYLVLLALQERDDVPVSDLGARLLLDSGTLTPLLKRLEAAGYVARERDPEDERRLRVRLTARARALRPDFERVRGEAFAASGLSAAEVARLREQLDRLRATLEAATRHR